MAESTEHPEELPIFPLSTVLFPGAILPLHIFEDRYKQMMRHAIEHEGMFGLSYRSDAAIGQDTLPEIGSIGCVAKINAVVPLADGRMNVISTGLVRYRVIGLPQAAPFIVARIETLGDDLEPGEDLNRLFVDIARLFKEFMEAANALDELNGPINQDFPEDAEAFSLVVSSFLPIDNDAKQALLEMTSTKLRFTRLRPYLTTALSQFSVRIRIQQKAKSNGHGRIPEGAESED